ncbi:transferase family-domain-containing protein [Fusarium venenatum]|uniref:transferase family-domain-containing protein n=1 Tax=Fusarium venenatum TaxID=56646 RepID=UPI001D2103FB|nr:transferase family-domain-containing protein [Fusarium venenatum]
MNPSCNTKQPQANNFVRVEDYGLHQPSAQQKLTPLDMNLPRLYGARWVLCFPLLPGSDKLQVYKKLKQGLAHTVVSIPWISGTIGPEDGQDPDNGRIQIVESSGSLLFPYNDLTGVMSSYAELKEQNFPLSALSTAQLGPIDVMPQGAIQPVFATQANFVEGGLLLTVGVHHSACDASALDTIVSTWAHNTAAVSDGIKSFAPFDKQSNDRYPLMEGNLDTESGDSYGYQLMPTPSGSNHISPNFEMPPLSSRLFHFLSESLKNLKETAEAFSTHDALLAFIWQHMTLARLKSGVFANPPGDADMSALCLAVNVRSRMSPPLPPSYLGNASMPCVTEKLPVSAITSDASLPRVAAIIRKSLAAFNNPGRVSATIGLLNSRTNPTDFKLAFHGFLGPDVVESSWTDLGVYGNVWGAMGMLDAFRVPGEGADGAITILPRLRDGSLEVVIALKTEAMEKMIDDKSFAEAVNF